MTKVTITPPKTDGEPQFYLGAESGALYVRNKVLIDTGWLAQHLRNQDTYSYDYICIVGAGGIKAGEVSCIGNFTPVKPGSIITIEV